MQKVFNTAVVIVFTLVIMTPSALFVIEKAGFDLPSWLTSEDAKSLSGGITDGNVGANLSIEGFSGKKLQSAIENEMGNRIPLKASVMLGNARIQRAVIELANLPFGWGCYPTKFKSEVCAVPGRRALVGTTRKPSEKNNDGVAGIMNMIASSSERNPDVQFLFDVVIDTYSSEANPTYKYMTGTYTPEWINEYIITPLESARVKVIVDTIASEDELFNEWHTTEHHWRIQRALSSYRKIADTLDWNDSFAAGGDSVSVSEDWKGSNARLGLDFDYEDWLADEPTSFANLEAFDKAGTPIQRGLRNAFLEKTTDSELPYYDVYHVYYGQPVAEFIYRNNLPNARGTCLFIEQSYGVPLEPYIASNYATTVCISPMNATVDKTLDEYISEYEVDDVVIQLGFTNMFLAKDRSPVFFFGK